MADVHPEDEEGNEEPPPLIPGTPDPPDPDPDPPTITCVLCHDVVHTDDYVAHLAMHADIFPSLTVVLGPQGIVDFQLRLGNDADVHLPFAFFNELEDDYEFLTELGNRIGNVPRGFPTPEARARVMNGITLVREDGTLCVVCQEAMTPATDAVELLCGHLFCRGCIDAWLAVSKRCPVCSADMDELGAGAGAEVEAEVD